MLDFRPIEIADKAWLDPIIRKGNLKTSDMNFTNLYTWSGGFKGEVAQVGDWLCLKFGFFKGRPCYAFPVGADSVTDAMEILMADARERGVPFSLRVSMDSLPLLEKYYSGCYELDSSDKWDDYIYSAERLATLSGKKLHAKRNHIHRFEEQYKWSFEPVDRSKLEDCHRMCMNWMEQVSEERHASYDDELVAIEKLFSDYDSLQPEGGLLRADGEVVAFTFGEQLSDDTFLVHFEKAYPHIQGGYTMMNREFVRFILDKYPQIKWFNREEDMGLDNLRKAKQSYYPDMMMRKYIANWR